MTLAALLQAGGAHHRSLILSLLPFTLLALRFLYRLSPLHPLARIPGPYLPRLSSLWLTYHAWIGDECTAVHQLHKKYGPIVRTGPMSVDIADGDALQTIYVEKGGFRKASFYGNFDIGGHKSIFSELEPDRRAIRAKAVLPMFSTANLRKGRETIYECVNLWVERMKQEVEGGKPVNVLNLTRGLAVDAVSLYLFGKRYGGLDEDPKERKAAAAEPDENETSHGMTAGAMVNSFVAVGRYWYLPSWAFAWLEWAESKLYPDWEVLTSMKIVDNFVAGVVDEAEMQKAKDDSTYQVRLLDAGISVSETRAQCKDLIFAGTDSTGMNLGTICFMLAKHPDKYEKLRKEVLEAKPTEDEVQSLPYLRGVVWEGLRISMANPSRLPRVVPAGGWTFKGTDFPQGTEVSCTPFELHFNGEVFDDPREFRPERWLDANDQMRRDSIPFGLGSRQCIARNLATMELCCAVQRLAEEDVLRGAKCCKDRIEILEWFNSKVTDEKIELAWS